MLLLDKFIKYIDFVFIFSSGDISVILLLDKSILFNEASFVNGVISLILLFDKFKSYKFVKISISSKEVILLLDKSNEYILEFPSKRSGLCYQKSTIVMIS